MESINSLSNSAVISARASAYPVFSHEVYGEKFYSFNAECMRRSGRVDTIPCIAPQRMLPCIVQDKLSLYSGQVRSCNKTVDGGSRLIISMFVKGVSENAFDDTLNEITLQGYVCKKPVYRKTPFGREIADMLIAVNRSFGKSDYIPAIAWGINARNAAELEIGQKIHVEGRLQSREYEKMLEDGTIIRRTAYEVSVYALLAVE